MASSSAAERAEGSKKMRRRRGENVVLTFSQQGWGERARRVFKVASGIHGTHAFCRLPQGLPAIMIMASASTVYVPSTSPARAGNFSNTLAILLLLAVQGATGAQVSSSQAEVTWRVQFAIGTAICAALAAYRWLNLQAGSHLHLLPWPQLLLLPAICSLCLDACPSYLTTRAMHARVCGPACICGPAAAPRVCTRPPPPWPWFPPPARPPGRSPRYGKPSGMMWQSTWHRKG